MLRNLLTGLGKLIQPNAVQTSPKQGQMLGGKVMELLPQNRAIVRFGNQQIQAQLETSLAKGQTYLFQVEKTNPLLQLKVVEKPLTTSKGLDIQQLLLSMGVTASKHNKQLLKQLIQHEIPFQTSDLKRALTIMNQTDNRSVAKDVLVQMFQKRLPIQSSIFHALHMKKTTEMSQVLNQLHEDVRESKVLNEQKLQTVIAQLKGTSSSLSSVEMSVMKIMSEVSAGKDTSFRLFKHAGLINEPSMSYPQFQHIWKQWHEKEEDFHDQPLAVSREQQLVRSGSTSSPPFPKPLETIFGQLKQLFEQQLPMTTKEQQTLKKWSYTLEQMVRSLNDNGGKPHMDHLSSSLQKQWSTSHTHLHTRNGFDKLLPLLSHQDKMALQEVLKQAPLMLKSEGELPVKSIETVLNAMKRIEDHQLPSPQKKVLVDWLSRSGDMLSFSEKDKIMIQLKSMMEFSGFKDENRLASSLQQGTFTNEDTLKSLLIQSMNEGTAVRPETAKQMLHLLNGIQLTAQQESQQTLQIALQFPGDVLAALSDIHMNMEGRKTSEGDIDPDYCHIIFYLDLAYLRETVIDLNIVDRRVAVIVYNDSPHIESVLEQYKGSLHDGLAHAGYELSSLVARPTKQTEGQARPSTTEPKEGMDIRI